MNATRRKLLADILDRLSSIKAKIDELKNLEQEAFDNLPEGIQGSERAEKIQANVEIMDDAVNSIDDLEEQIGELLGTSYRFVNVSAATSKPIARPKYRPKRGLKSHEVTTLAAK